MHRRLFCKVVVAVEVLLKVERGVIIVMAAIVVGVDAAKSSRATVMTVRAGWEAGEVVLDVRDTMAMDTGVEFQGSQTIRVVTGAGSVAGIIDMYTVGESVAWLMCARQGLRVVVQVRNERTGLAVVPWVRTRLRVRRGSVYHGI